MDSLKSRSYGFRVLGIDRSISLLVDASGKSYVRRGGKVVPTHLDVLGASAVSLVVGQERYFFCAERLPEGLRLVYDGNLCCIREQAIESPRLFAELFGQPTIVLKSQMPGLIAALNVKVNQYVKEGETVLVIEAMKMQNPIQSPCSGKIRKLFVSAGASVEGGIPLLEMERLKS